MKVCASQRYNSPAYFPISFHFTLSQNIIQVFLFLILFADRSLFWFQFRFLFNSFWRSIFILVSVFILFYFILLCHKILSKSLSLSNSFWHSIFILILLSFHESLFKYQFILLYHKVFKSLQFFLTIDLYFGFVFTLSYFILLCHKVSNLFWLLSQSLFQYHFILFLQNIEVSLILFDDRFLFWFRFPRKLIPILFYFTLPQSI